MATLLLIAVTNDGQRMKSLMLIGALTGFLIGAAFSLSQGNSLATTLWHASAAAYGASLLSRWWGHAWRKSLTLSLEERQHAAAHAAQATPLKPLNALPKTAKS